MVSQGFTGFNYSLAMPAFQANKWYLIIKIRSLLEYVLMEYPNRCYLSVISENNWGNIWGKREAHGWNHYCSAPAKYFNILCYKITHNNLGNTVFSYLLPFYNLCCFSLWFMHMQAYTHMRERERERDGITGSALYISFWRMQWGNCALLGHRPDPRYSLILVWIVLSDIWPHRGVLQLYGIL